MISKYRNSGLVLPTPIDLLHILAIMGLNLGNNRN
jgi:hypothetical protein